MIRNYIKVALRNMMRSFTFTVINIVGLALAMSICLVLIMIVGDQLSYDKHISNHDRIYRIIYDNANEDRLFSKMATSAPMLGVSLKENYSGIEQVARLRNDFGNNWIGIDNDLNIPIGGFFADPEILNMFDLELEHGDAETALLKPNSVVITREACKKLFTIDNPVGEIIKVGDLGEYIVTGVLRETDNKSHIKFEALASMSSLAALVADSTLRSDVTSWTDVWSYWTYITLEEGVDPNTIEGYLEMINKEQYGENEEANYTFELQALTSITPGPLLGNQIGPGMPMFIVYFLAGLCLLIMVSAGFNYTNLSVARALTRAREVGIRKVSGAVRQQIMWQFISEAIIVALFSLLVSFVLLIALQPAFQGLKFSQLLHWDLSFSGVVIAFCALFAIMVGIMAGLFPAIFLSSLKPISVLKDFSGVKLFSKVGLRKSLIIAQFGLSLFLIISVTLVQDQMEMMMSADYGFDKENIISVKLGDTSAEILKNNFRSESTFSSVAAASHSPSMGRSSGADGKRNAEDEEIGFNFFSVDENYLQNMSIPLVAGDNFTQNMNKENEVFMIVNEKFTKSFGFDAPGEAIGEQILVDDELELTIIGVVKDYNHEPLMSSIGPMALRYVPERFRQIQVKYTGSREDAVKRIEAGWANVNPGIRIDYMDMEVEIAQFYEFLFSDLVKITSVISVLAISIACLGLLGMALFTAETKAKEVSIRKVLGADSRSIIIMLSKSYFMLLLISVIISIPLTYVINNFWLDLLAYRVQMGINVVLFGVGIMLSLGILMILSQTLRAARSNTVDSLRAE